MAELKEFLVKSNTNLVVIVEDNIVPYDKDLIPELLDQILNLWQLDFDNLVDELSSMLNEDLINNLMEFYCEIISKDEAIERLNGKLNKEIFNLFRKYGLAYFNDQDDYKTIIESVKNKDIAVRIYSEINQDDYDNYIDEIKKWSQVTESNYILLIIDKRINSEDTIGLDFLHEIREDDDLKNKTFSVVFSTNAIESDLTNISDYFQIQVQKGNNVLGNIYQGILKCSLAIVFHFFEKNFIESIKHANKLAIDNFNNIEYLLKQFRKEGASGYLSLMYWFHIVLNYYVNKTAFVNDIGDYLTKLDLLENFINFEFNENIISGVDQLNTEIFEICTSEIFDYYVNQKRNPIAPGDVFKKGDKYYLLIGQECDLSLRKPTYSRNEKFAELIKLEIHSFDEIKKSSTKEKKDMKNRKVNYNKDSAYLNYFNVGNEKKIIEIPFSKKCRLYADFIVLDLCTFNEEGVCEISLSGLNESDEYLSIVSERLKFYDELSSVPKNVLLPYLDISILDADAQEAKNNKFIFGIQRVCKINKEFYDFVKKLYSDYNTRVGLNTVTFTQKNEMLT